MAMKIGGEYNPRYVALRHFLRMGEAAGLSERLVRAEIRKVSEAAFRALPDALDEVRVLQPAEVYHDIAKGFHRSEEVSRYYAEGYMVNLGVINPVSLRRTATLGYSERGFTLLSPKFLQQLSIL